MEAAVPLHIISGFLGVGKTTAILHLLKQLGNRERVAIVVNEWGKVGLDGAIIASETPGLVLREVTGGCICCTAGPALASSLQEILARVRPERILLEPSGVGKPGDITDLIHSMGIPNRIHVRPVVTLVDPGYFIDPHMMELPIFRDQVESADILVANRCDLAGEETVKAFYRKAQGLFPPKETILTTAFGRLPEGILSWERRGSVRRMEPQTTASVERSKPPPHWHGRSDTIGFREEGWIWPSEIRFDHHALRRTMEEAIPARLGPFQGKTLRLKGIFRTDRGWHLMEVAVDGFSERRTQYRRDNRCQVILAGEEYETYMTEIGDLLRSCIGC